MVANHASVEGDFSKLVTVIQSDCSLSPCSGTLFLFYKESYQGVGTLRFSGSNFILVRGELSNDNHFR